MKNTFAAIALFMASILAFSNTWAFNPYYEDDDDASYNDTGAMPANMGMDEDDDLDEDEDLIPPEGVPMGNSSYYGVEDSDDEGVDFDTDYSDDQDRDD